MKEGYGCVCCKTNKKIPCLHNPTHLKSVRFTCRKLTKTHEIITSRRPGVRYFDQAGVSGLRFSPGFL